MIVQGEHGDAFFALLLGEVDVIVNDAVVGQLTVPQCFGDRALEGDGKGGNQGVRAATIRAAGNVTVARLQAESYYACMERSVVRQSALAAMTAMEVSESDRTADHRQTLLQWVGSVPFFQKQRAERGSASGDLQRLGAGQLW